MQPKKEYNNSSVYVQGSLAFQLGFVIIIPILGGFFLGRYLDEKLGTQPIFKLGLMILGLVLSYFSARNTISKIIKLK